MKQYLELLQDILDHGVRKGDRTGTGTLSVFGRQYRHDLATGFPLLTTKKLHFKGIANELLWFLRGDTNTRWLKENGVSIWDEWATEDGELGPIYGAQWTAWPSHDGSTINQIDYVIDCHLLYQFYVAEGRLSAQLMIRSSDSFLGLPYNTASLALLTLMLAQQCDLVPGEIIICTGDSHIYSNHMEQVQKQLTREPLPLPRMNILRRPDSIYDYRFEDFDLQDYSPHAHISAPVAV